MSRAKPLLLPEIRYDVETETWVEVPGLPYDQYKERREPRSRPDPDLQRTPLVKTFFRIETAPLFRPEANAPARMGLTVIDETRRYICRLESEVEERGRRMGEAMTEACDEHKAACEARDKLKDAKLDLRNAEARSERQRDDLRQANDDARRLIADVAQERRGILAVLHEILPLVGVEPDWTPDAERAQAQVKSLIEALGKPL